MLINYFSGQLSTISALLVIGCLRPPSSLANHVSSASLHRYTPVLVGVALLGHHSAKAEFRKVNGSNFKGTPYEDSPVRVNGSNIFFTLNQQNSPINVAWRFEREWRILLEKCDNGNPYADFQISDSSSSCTWVLEWLDKEKFTLKPLDTSTEEPWKFGDLSAEVARPVRKLRIDIGSARVPMMDLFAFTNETGTAQSPGPGIKLVGPRYCMLEKGNFSVSMSNTVPCPVKVTILNAELFYDFREPTTTPATTATQSGNEASGHGSTAAAGAKDNDDRKSNGSSDSNIIYYAAGGGAVGFVLLAVAVGLIVFCFIRRRGRAPPFDKDADNAQITQTEGLIEWEDIMAHAPYKSELAKQIQEDEWMFVKGDKVDLRTVKEYECSNEAFKILEFLEEVKGNEDYGVVKGKFDGIEPAVIYYSKPSVRVKTCLARHSRLYELHRNHGQKALARSPMPKYFWISPDPEKFSYVVLERHGMSVAEALKASPIGAPLHERVGFAYNTFSAISSIHRLGCVHRDVTPAAFMVRNCSKDDVQFCYISHLSLSRFQYDVLTNSWMPRRRHVKYFGTHKYASRAAHAQQERYFKDDLESWFYTAVDLIWPTTAEKLVMPWHILSSEIRITDRAVLHKKYKAQKDKFLRTFGKNQLIQTFPAPQFRILATEILKMAFDTMASDYKPGFHKLLHGMMEQLPTQVDEEYHDAIVEFLTNMNNVGAYEVEKFKF